MTAPALLLLACFAATVRHGGTVDLLDETPGGRVVKSLTKFRIGPSRIDGDTEFQIQVETTSKSGRTATAPFSFCDWTPQGLLEVLTEYDADGDLVLVPASWVEKDPVASAIARMDVEDFAAGANRYRFVNGQVKALTPLGGSDYAELDPVHHRMDDLLLVSIPPFQLAA